MSIISVDFRRNLAVRLFLNISLTPWLCISAQHHSASSMQHAWRRDGGRLCWGALSQESVFCALMGHIELLGAQHIMVWWEREVLWGQSKHLLGHKYPGMFTCLLRTWRFPWELPQESQAAGSLVSPQIGSEEREKMTVKTGRATGHSPSHLSTHPSFAHDEQSPWGMTIYLPPPYRHLSCHPWCS